MSAAVVARGMVQVLGRHFSLGPIDLDLAGGERLAVLGDNGAGKTTLLRILATATRPAAGSLELFGLDASAGRERLRPRLGYLGHQLGLYPALTARENLEFFATLHEVERRRVAEALAEGGLEAVAGRRVEQLSRGQQQRLDHAAPTRAPGPGRARRQPGRARPRPAGAGAAGQDRGPGDARPRPRP